MFAETVSAEPTEEASFPGTPPGGSSSPELSVQSPQQLIPATKKTKRKRRKRKSNKKKSGAVHSKMPDKSKEETKEDDSCSSSLSSGSSSGSESDGRFASADHGQSLIKCNEVQILEETKVDSPPIMKSEIGGDDKSEIDDDGSDAKVQDGRPLRLSPSAFQSQSQSRLSETDKSSTIVGSGRDVSLSGTAANIGTSIGSSSRLNPAAKSFEMNPSKVTVSGVDLAKQEAILGRRALEDFPDGFNLRFKVTRTEKVKLLKMRYVNYRDLRKAALLEDEDIQVALYRRLEELPMELATEVRDMRVMMDVHINDETGDVATMKTKVYSRRSQRCLMSIQEKVNGSIRVMISLLNEGYPHVPRLLAKPIVDLFEDDQGHKHLSVKMLRLGQPWTLGDVIAGILTDHPRWKLFSLHRRLGRRTAYVLIRMVFELGKPHKIVNGHVTASNVGFQLMNQSSKTYTLMFLEWMNVLEFARNPRVRYGRQQRLIAFAPFIDVFSLCKNILPEWIGVSHDLNHNDDADESRQFYHALEILLNMVGPIELADRSYDNQEQCYDHCRQWFRRFRHQFQQLLH